MTDGLTRLPREPADRLTKPFIRFLRIESVAALVLLLSTITALVLSNSAWSSEFLGLWELRTGIKLGDVEIARSIKHWINSGLMTFFFFVIALELKRELVLGELNNARAAALPISAALGGMLVPAGVFVLLLGNGPGASGWGTVMSTDTAFVVGCLAILGSRIPHSLRLFLLSLAIFDDVGAILVVAVGYGERLDWIALAFVGVGLAVVAAIARLGIRSIAAYFVIGAGIWLALDLSGIHATLAGVILGLMTPSKSWVSDRRLQAILQRVTARPAGEDWSGDAAARSDLQRARVATVEALSPIERLELALHPWVAFIVLPIFALANAGVPIANANFDQAITIVVVAAFVVGKPVGVVLFSVLAVGLRVGTRPKELPWSLLMAGSLLTGIGFTMALFIAELAFEDDLLGAVKIGVLGASVISAALGVLALLVTSARCRA